MTEPVRDAAEAIVGNLDENGYLIESLADIAASEGHQPVDLEEALRLSPDLPHGYKNLAWLLATCPLTEMRDGKRAVACARKALDIVGERQPEWFGILAAACAEVGDFAEAVRWQTKCLEHASVADKPEHARRLALYQNETPLLASHALAFEPQPFDRLVQTPQAVGIALQRASRLARRCTRPLLVAEHHIGAQKPQPAIDVGARSK